MEKEETARSVDSACEADLRSMLTVLISLRLGRFVPRVSVLRQSVKLQYVARDNEIQR